MTVALRDERFALGIKSPIRGLMRSVTRPDTRVEAAAPMMKAIARPMTPKVWRKSTNSLKKPFLASEALSILSAVAQRAWVSF